MILKALLNSFILHIGIFWVHSGRHTTFLSCIWVSFGSILDDIPQYETNHNKSFIWSVLNSHFACFEIHCDLSMHNSIEIILASYEYFLKDLWGAPDWLLLETSLLLDTNSRFSYTFGLIWMFLKSLTTW